MSAIKVVTGRTILDSRGLPTVEAEVTLVSGACGRASVGAGAAPGPWEAVEIRDGGDEWLGYGVDRCVRTLGGEIAAVLAGREGSDQRGIDEALMEADGTPRKEVLGANTLLAASLAVAKAASEEADTPLWRYLASSDVTRMPVPLMNVMHGGPTAPSPLDFQEFMVVPYGAGTFSAAVRAGAEIYHRLRLALVERGLSTAVGDEGGFCPGLRRTEDALDALVEAIASAGYAPGRDVGIAIDVGASGLWHKVARRYLLWHAQSALSSQELTEYLARLRRQYPLISIEDGMDEEDWDGWGELTTRLGASVQLVGDDIFSTNLSRLKRGIDAGVANAIVVKPNEVGTLTETLDLIAAARSADYPCIVSHRSGDTDDQSIADIAVASQCAQVKFGAPARGERTARYNHLMRVEGVLGERAEYAGHHAFR
jgi:enolase